MAKMGRVCIGARHSNKAGVISAQAGCGAIWGAALKHDLVNNEHFPNYGHEAASSVSCRWICWHYENANVWTDS